MNLPMFWNADWTAPLINHLWQSTVVVAIAWVLALALRKNHARARYWVWMAASVKFLLPFSLLMTAGESLRSFFAAPIVAKPALANAMEQIAQPFPQTQFFDAAQAPVTAHHGNLLSAVLLAIWICGALVVVGRLARAWWRVFKAKQAAQETGNRRSFDFAWDDSAFNLTDLCFGASGLAAGVTVLVSPASIEPGIFGIFRPVLLLPEGILERLTPEQLEAIVAHEMCHLRRRDNLTFAIHMIVEALFWFHPAVWWIGARLIEERERACDEAVLQSGSEAETYAEGILNVCKFYVESPLECVAGVTGSDLKQRIVRIMACHAGQKMSLGRKLLLGAAGLLVVATPVAFGLIHAEHGFAQSQAEDSANKLPTFEVASVKQNISQSTESKINSGLSDRFVATNVPLRFLILDAFELRDHELVGAPNWTWDRAYDVIGTYPGARQPPAHEIHQMLQQLLADRFGLKVHREQRELPAYDLVVARKDGQLGAQIHKSDMNCAAWVADGRPKTAAGLPSPVSPSGKRTPCTMIATRTWLTGGARTMKDLTASLQSMLGKPVVDSTGLTASYDIDLQWAAMDLHADETASATSSEGPSLFTALQEQLGLKLVPHKEQFQVLIVDEVKPPTPN